MIRILQGIAFAMTPAAGALLTNGQYHDLAPSEYGALFIPMVFGALFRFRSKGAANAFAMALFAATTLFLNDPLVSYVLLLVSLFFVGLGFSAAASPIGMALTPLLLYGAEFFGVWWAFPVLAALLFLFYLPFVEEEGREFHLLSLFEGFCEAVFAIWMMIYMTSERNLGSLEATLALSCFFGALAAKWKSRSLLLGAFPLFAFFPNPGSALVGGLGLSSVRSFSYLMGYGIAAYGGGIAYEWFDVSLQSFYLASTCVVILMLPFWKWAR